MRPEEKKRHPCSAPATRQAKSPHSPLRDPRIRGHLPVGPHARHLLPIDAPAPRRLQLLKLSVERLAVGADTGIAEVSALRFFFGQSLWKAQAIEMSRASGVTESFDFRIAVAVPFSIGTTISEMGIATATRRPRAVRRFLSARRARSRCRRLVRRRCWPGWSVRWGRLALWGACRLNGRHGSRHVRSWKHALVYPLLLIGHGRFLF